MSNTQTSTKERWSSRLMFILAVTGSAVGLGNIWKFPYITGENGGGAFVLIYLICIAAIGIPIMIAEIMLGRSGRQSPINTMRILAKNSNAHPSWRYLGWFGVITGFIILSYYSVIAGWTLAYIVKAINCDFTGVSANDAQTIFSHLVASPLQLTLWHSVFMLATMWIVARGVHNGIEKAVRLLMPSLLILLILLVAYALSYGDYARGLDFLFTPDFSKISGESILIAMGHAFFTLSLGMGAIMIYGSYLPTGISIAKVSIIIAIADTGVALLAGIAIFPLVFANGLEPTSGPGLIFQTLPIAFGQMSGGTFFAIIFFVLLGFAAFTSSISIIEPAVAWLVENKGWQRSKACIYAGLLTWGLGMGTVFSFNYWKDIQFYSMTFFDFMDALTANIMLPIGGMLIAIFSGWVMRESISREQLDMGKFYRLWYFLIRFVAPVSVFIVLLHAVGIAKTTG